MPLESDYPPPDPAFAEEFRAFAEEEARGGLPSRPVIFYGSSSIRLWEGLGGDFMGWPVLNRGFGGSTLAGCLHEFDRLVRPHCPRALVFYAGDNDLEQGAQPADLLALFERWAARQPVRTVHFISIKPSPVRAWNLERIREANRVLREAIERRWPEIHWVEIFQPMVDGQGQPRGELFTEDGLHMNRAGYALWQTAVSEGLARAGVAQGA